MRGTLGGGMSRGEMIRRLDEVSREVKERLENGPLTAEERHTLATSLSRLLPIVADNLQNTEDHEAAEALLRRHDSSAAAGSDPPPG